jgi:hypothetical protein
VNYCNFTIDIHDDKFLPLSNCLRDKIKNGAGQVARGDESNLEKPLDESLDPGQLSVALERLVNDIEEEGVVLGLDHVRVQHFLVERRVETVLDGTRRLRHLMQQTQSVQRHSKRGHVHQFVQGVKLVAQGTAECVLCIRECTFHAAQQNLQKSRLQFSLFDANLSKWKSVSSLGLLACEGNCLSFVVFFGRFI